MRRRCVERAGVRPTPLEQPLGHRRGRVRRQTVERDPQTPGSLRQHVGLEEQLRTRGTDNKARAPHSLDHVLDHLEQRPLSPVQIVEHDDQRPLGGEDLEHPLHAPEHLLERIDHLDEADC